jgi:hypothetical protein
MSLMQPKDTFCSQTRDVAGYESGLSYVKPYEEIGVFTGMSALDSS